MMKKSLLIFMLLLAVTVVFTACAQSNETSDVQSSVSSPETSNSESEAQSTPDKSNIENSEDESHQWIVFSMVVDPITPPDESIPETSEVSTPEESDDYSDIIPEQGYSDENGDNIHYCKAKAFKLNVLSDAIGQDALEDALMRGLRTDPYYYQFELQWPDIYTAIKFSDVTKEQFEKANSKQTAQAFTQEEIDALFSGDDALVKKTFKLKTTFYHEGRLYKLQDVCTILAEGLQKGNPFYESYNENGELVEYLQYMERALESGKFDDTYEWISISGKENTKHIYLHLIRYALEILLRNG